MRRHERLLEVKEILAKEMRKNRRPTRGYISSWRRGRTSPWKKQVEDAPKTMKRGSRESKDSSFANRRGANCLSGGVCHDDTSPRRVCLWPYALNTPNLFIFISYI